MPEEIVRQSLALKGRPARGVEERLALRFPQATAFLAKLVWRLPRRFPLRQALVRRSVTLGWEAMNRVDLEFGLALYAEDVESSFDRRVRTLGLNDCRGREARRRTLADVYAHFREMRFYPEELIDLGDDRLLVIGQMKGAGRSSGVPSEMEWANLWTISDGLVVRDQQFGDHAEALEAAGLSD